MNSALLDPIIEAVLYEGYILYPYRPSSKKNRRERFTFGRVYPQSCSLAREGLEPSLTQTECLAKMDGSLARLSVSLRFLQPMSRDIGTVDCSSINPEESEFNYRVVPELRVGGEIHQTWLEAIERRVDAPGLCLEGKGDQHSVAFRFPATRNVERICEGKRLVGVVVRQQAAIEGRLEVAARLVAPGLFKITAQALNTSSSPDPETNSSEELLKRTFASAHMVLEVQGAEFISLMDPDPCYHASANTCKNIGTWPVLVGDESLAERHTLLSSPIILYDYPKVAAESAGPLFDGTEIDEILTLRILTMTEEEKSEMRQVDVQARRLLERTESLSPESLLQMHGSMRSAPPERSTAPRPEADPNPQPTLAEPDLEKVFGTTTPLDGIAVDGIYLRRGARVRIRPRARADVLDLALSGQTAIIEAIELDAERRVHLAVVVENDPGRDLGMLRQPGHRFFYGVDEVEPLEKAEP